MKMTRMLALVLTLALLLPMLGGLPQAKAEGQKLIALTFDDGPSAQTDRLLDKLAEYGGHATFFVCGYRIVDYPSQLQRIVDEGHQAANHTENHKNNLANLSAENMAYEINTNLERLKKAGGDTIYALRPVGGAYNDRLKAAAQGPLFNWSLDTLDWKHRDADYVYNNIMQAKDGEIVLMHDLYKSTVDAACRAIPELVKNGYELVTVQELFRRKGVTLETGTMYTSAKAYETLPDAVSEAYPSVVKPTIINLAAQADANGTYTATVDAATLQKGTVSITTPFANVILPKGSLVAQAFTVSIRQESDGASVDVYRNGIRQEKLIKGLIVELLGSSFTPGSVAALVSPSGTRTDIKESGAISAKALRAHVEGSARVAVSATTPIAFRDTNGEWVKNAADFVSSHGMLSGVSSDMYGPYTGMTRGMMATVLWRMAGEKKATATSRFTDVKASVYYAPAIDWAAENRIVDGIGDNKFAPESNLTREQTIMLLYRYMGGNAHGDSSLPCAGWARDAYAWARDLGILTKDSAAWLRPAGDISRAEVAVLLHRAVIAGLYV